MPRSTFFNLPPAKRQRIIEAAVQEFAASPYAIANLDRVVERAGISKGSMYQYFDGKADLYRWLLTEYLPDRKAAAVSLQPTSPTTSVWDTLIDAFRAGVAFALAEPALTRLGVRFLRDHGGDRELLTVAEAHRNAAEAWLTALLRAGQARGELRADLDLPAVSGLLAYGLGEGMLDPVARHLGITLVELLDSPERIREISEADVTRLVSSVVDLLRRGIAAPVPE